MVTFLYEMTDCHAEGGGVCMWCRHQLRPEVISTVKNELFEKIVVYLRKIDCLLLLVYLPPNLYMYSSDMSMIRTLLTDVIDEHLITHPCSSIILCGDFNNHDMSDVEISFDITNIVNAPTRKQYTVVAKSLLTSTNFLEKHL